VGLWEKIKKLKNNFFFKKISRNNFPALFSFLKKFHFFDSPFLENR
jgi:hypothetical protein